MTASGSLDELVQLRGENLAALRALVALPHPDAIPASWRPGSHPSIRKETITLADVVALLAEHLPSNSVGTPRP